VETAGLQVIDLETFFKIGAENEEKKTLTTGDQMDRDWACAVVSQEQTMH